MLKYVVPNHLPFPFSMYSFISAQFYEIIRKNDTLNIKRTNSLCDLLSFLRHNCMFNCIILMNLHSVPHWTFTVTMTEVVCFSFHIQLSCHSIGFTLVPLGGSRNQNLVHSFCVGG